VAFMKNYLPPRVEMCAKNVFFFATCCKISSATQHAGMDIIRLGAQMGSVRARAKIYRSGQGVSGSLGRRDGGLKAKQLHAANAFSSLVFFQPPVWPPKKFPLGNKDSRERGEGGLDRRGA
jgi:hypothetical protein